MSYVEAITNPTETQRRLHREKQERDRRLSGFVKDRGIRIAKPERGIRGVEAERIIALERQAAREKHQAKISAENVAKINAAIEALKNPHLIVGYVNITQNPSVMLETMQDTIRMVGIRSIQQTVCDTYRVTMSELTGLQRTQNVVLPRQIAMYLCKKLTGRSLPEIGRMFGGKDHTTVLHNVRKMQKMMDADDYFRFQVNSLIQQIEAGV